MKEVFEKVWELEHPVPDKDGETGQRVNICKYQGPNSEILIVNEFSNSKTTDTKNIRRKSYAVTLPADRRPYDTSTSS